MSHQEHDFTRRMRERGFRVTPQRQLILDAICASGGHTTPEEIVARVQAQAPALNRATVYRTLDFLCELRLVVAMKIGDHTYYEIAGETPHHHLVCRACGGQLPLDHAELERLFRSVARTHRFLIDMDHVALFGLCEQCQQPARAGHGRAPERNERKV
jgi:Fur family ferric uptake transcriptional regulator